MDETTDTSPPQETESLCPVCFRRIKARRICHGDEVFLVKECPDHGSFKTVLWRGKPSMSEWQRPKGPVHPDISYTQIERGCPFDCGLCNAHEQLPCSVLIEVTDRCNLHCPVCFADSGVREIEDPSLERLSWLLERAMAAAGPCNLQLSGGEPTLRDDLPDIIGLARGIGFSFIQVNTNGLRLSKDKDYAVRLKEAGLSSVFLQFDGTDDTIYRALRGRGLLDNKLPAVRNCGEVGLGVILVPTLIKGVNTGNVGDIVRQALAMSPTVRGVHFQPVSYFGRFPVSYGDEGRFTLPELMSAIEDQTAGLMNLNDFSPPGCEHSHCSFHATYMHTSDGGIRLIGAAGGDNCCPLDLSAGGVNKTVDTVSTRWRLPSNTSPLSDCSSLSGERACCGRPQPFARDEGDMDLDLFLREIASRSFTISAMAFQDAENLDLERLRGCCISVVSQDGMLVPFCAYNLTARDGKGLYRRRSRSRQ